MRIVALSFLCFLICTRYGQAQCDFEDIFSVKHGFSKFEAITSIASDKNIKEDVDRNKFSIDSWDKYDYLKGDSVRATSLFYDYIYHSCLKGEENELGLCFVDDKLYLMKFTLTFSKTKFVQCMDNYNTLVSIIKKQFPYNTEFVVNNNELHEQVGKGYWFYPLSYEERDKIKIENISIGYEIKYEWQWNPANKKSFQTGNVENYVIKIEYINLKGTKLTNEGYPSYQ